MSTSTSVNVAEGGERLNRLVSAIRRQAGFSDVVAALQHGRGASLSGTWGSACALAVAALAQEAPGPVVAVTSHLDDLDVFAEEVATFADREVDVFPAWEIPPDEHSIRDDIYADRLKTLKDLARGTRPLVATSVHGLLQPAPSHDLLAQCTRTLRVGEEIDLDRLLAWLVEHGLRNMTAVELPGEFSLRGGILDLFASDWDAPVRLELFGDEIESLRQFDVGTQRSLTQLSQIDVTLLPEEIASHVHVAEHFPADTWWLLIEPADLEDVGRRWLKRLSRRRGLFTVESTFQRILEGSAASISQLDDPLWDDTCAIPTESVERFSGTLHALGEMLDRTITEDEVVLVCAGENQAAQLADALADCRLAEQGKLHYAIGRLRGGFRLVAEGATLLSGSELLHRPPPARRGHRQLGRAIDSFLELREGDYIVHLGHGIGRYLGMKVLDTAGHAEEHLEIEFRGGTKLFVPASKIDLVQKYVGPTKKKPTLSKIGGRMWARRKEQAEEAVIDLASELLEVQASRASRPGIRFEPDSLWQDAFESAFPYQETPDQLTALEDIKRDMHQPRPMDRLICGEVGYGKTELAMRAAFKAVDNGYQVAILVPTTILAEQHYRTFSERMHEFPFQIGVLSRFRTKTEQAAIVEGLRDGSVDIVIGTHRLVQPDVDFHNLGLVVVDEEQRFGVEAKERLKLLRQVVDVLTLTATPIPRTLHMSLVGIRDISNLETPPEDRLAVETRVSRFDEEIVRYAIMRELGRGGQIFFVHNRIHDIHKVAQRLEQLVPEARLAVAHGQMPEEKLNRTMLDFVDHKFDILLSTTIVESGLDIPNANTIFIDDADRYGLAELHQLRGRVGRYNRRAYCYLLVARHKSLTGDAAKRLRAIEEFSSIGAGFAIAMRDLEIRGAGNILGNEQSGHIAAIGYELYCQLLEHAVRKLKHLLPKQRVEVSVDLPGEAYLPQSYITDMRVKIDLYRRLSRVTDEAELSDLTDEMRDRFGPPPEVVRRLLETARLRIWAHRWEIDSIHLDQQYAALKYKSRNRVAELVLRSEGRLRVVDAHSAYFPLPAQATEPDEILSELQMLLQPQPA